MVRIKNRYLLVNILYPHDSESHAKDAVPELVALHQPTTAALTPQILLKAIRGEISDLFGDYGTGVVADSLAVKYLSTATSTFILRVSRVHYRLAWAALTFMDGIPIKSGRSCVFRVVRVSGTIRKAEEEAILRARDLILRARQRSQNEESSAIDKMFGQQSHTAHSTTSDTLMVDHVDSDEEDASGDESDRNG